MHSQGSTTGPKITKYVISKRRRQGRSPITAFSLDETRTQILPLRISLLVSTLFSDEFIVFTDHDYRYDDEFIVPGEFGGCVLNRSLNSQLAAVRQQAVIATRQLKGNNRPKPDDQPCR